MPKSAYACGQSLYWLYMAMGGKLLDCGQDAKTWGAWKWLRMAVSKEEEKGPKKKYHFHCEFSHHNRF